MTDGSDSGPADVEDRKAMDHILGRPLSRTSPKGALAPGSGVTVVRAPDWDGPWQVEFPHLLVAQAHTEPVRLGRTGSRLSSLRRVSASRRGSNTTMGSRSRR